MTTWVALLRGINVGGHNRLPMADLRAALESAGFGDVRTYLQSGNAVFTADARDEEALGREVGEVLARHCGLQVEVVVRSGPDLEAIAAANPFVARGAPVKELHAVFLSDPPPADAIAGLDRGALLPDEIEVGDRVIYCRLPNGIRGSRLPDWERLLGVTATTRNWNTVSHLLDLVA